MRAFVGAAALVLAGCAGPIDVARTVTPNEAASANGTSFRAAAIVRGQARAELPANVKVAANEILVPRPGTFTYSLDPGEKVVRDKAGNITAVAAPKGDETAHFIAGTAKLEGNDIHGELVDHVEHVPLLPGDRIELRGRFAPGESIPTGGRVGTTRATSALVFGAVLLGGAWLPSVIVAAASPVDANHWLYLPVIGPWVAYATRDACTPSIDPRPCLGDAAEHIAIIVDGILQGTGALLLVVGLPSSAEVRWGTQARLRITPTLGGASISGIF